MPYTPQTPSGKEQNQGRSLGDLWRVKQSGGPLELGTGWGPRQEVFTPYRDPTGLGSRPAWLQLYAIVTGSQQPGPPPGAPRYLAPPPAFVQRAAHNLVQAGLPGPPRCQGDSCRISLPGSSCWCPPKGGDPRDTGMPPTFSEGEKGPGPMAVLLKTEVLTPWLPTAGSRSNTTTKTFPAQKATSESFPCPPRSLFPAKTRFTANSRKSALQKCILPRPPSPPPGLGSVPKVGAPLRGFLPYLSQGQAS